MDRFIFRGAARRVVRILGRTRDDVRLRGAVMAAAAATMMMRSFRGFMVRFRRNAEVGAQQGISLEVGAQQALVARSWGGSAVRTGESARGVH